MPELRHPHTSAPDRGPITASSASSSEHAEAPLRELELRRHTMRVMPGQHLSQAGVELARRVGSTMGRFDRVVTSTIPRAFETAIAMGFAVDEQREELGLMPDEVAREIDWQGGCAALQHAARAGGVTARYVAEQGRVLREIAQALPVGGRALVISHGGIVEAGAVGCLPDYDFSAWTESASYCEGIRLRFDGHRFIDAAPLRLG
jgi:broad specificity phosphatase PhoE